MALSNVTCHCCTIKKHIVQSVVERDLDPLTSFLDDEGQQVPTHFEILKTRHVHIRKKTLELSQLQ
jgi:hypothetical protein